MDIEKAMRLKDVRELLNAAKEAEARNCSNADISKLWKLYREAAAQGLTKGSERNAGKTF